ncbi:MAG: hypothetical protein R3F11_18070 [Verrucomicrobiales bacterium]
MRNRLPPGNLSTTLSRRLANLAAAALLGILFAGALVRLFSDRFALGDVYPPYSTLRADPLGCMAYLEAADRLDGVAAERNRGRLRRIEGAGDAALLRLGADAVWLAEIPVREAEAMERFAEAGGHLVVALAATGAEDYRLTRLIEQQIADETGNPLPPSKFDGPDNDPPPEPMTSLAERWGLRVRAAPGESADNPKASCALGACAGTRIGPGQGGASAVLAAAVRGSRRRLAAGRPGGGRRGAIVERDFGPGGSASSCVRTPPSPATNGSSTMPHRRCSSGCSADAPAFFSTRPTSASSGNLTPWGWRGTTGSARSRRRDLFRLLLWRGTDEPGARRAGPDLRAKRCRRRSRCRHRVRPDAPAPHPAPLHPPSLF